MLHPSRVHELMNLEAEVSELRAQMKGSGPAASAWADDFAPIESRLHALVEEASGDAGVCEECGFQRRKIRHFIEPDETIVREFDPCGHPA